VIQAWIALWDRRESPGVLVAVRVLVASVLLFDFLSLWRLDLVEPIWGALEAGGIGNPMGRKKIPPLYQWFAPTSTTIWGVYITAIVSAFMLCIGAGTRLAAFVLLVTIGQLALVMAPADRGIDAFFRNILVVLCFSGCGRAWSVDAKVRTGRWRGDGQAVTAWPRLLLVCQFLVVYWTAGMQKVGLSWTPVEGFSAMYIVLRDPAFQVLSDATLDRFYFFTQVGTAMTWLWELSTPLAAYAWWCRATRTRKGRLRAWLSRVRFWQKWVLLGAVFHVGTAGFMHLEVFAFGMLAVYPVFFHPDEWTRVIARWRSGFRRCCDRARPRESDPARPR
jgi:hypothetical protein